MVAALILAAPTRSTAEINMADSIEWMTADSDLVVVAKVASVTPTMVGNAPWHAVTLALSDTLKGPTTTGTIDIMVAGVTQPKWTGERLVFLVGAKRRAIRDHECQETGPCTSRYLAAAYAIRAGRWGDQDTLALDGSAKAFTIAHDVISKRAELIAKVKASVGSKATQAFQMDLPIDSPAGKALWGGSAVWLYVPIDAALEQHAIAWIASKDGSQRDQGVAVLAHFKSAANIARLEKLLVDPATHDITEGSNPMVRRFFVRKRAHDVLRAWGVPHATPPIDTKPPASP